MKPGELGDRDVLDKMPHHVRIKREGFARTRLDGKPLREWLKRGGNMFDDYTLENHDRVHPDYMGTIRINLHQKLIYDWAGEKPPEALVFNARSIYANLKYLALPDGNFVYPNGQAQLRFAVPPAAQQRISRALQRLEAVA